MTELAQGAAFGAPAVTDEPVTYAGLLRLSALLDLQYPPRAHDELMFVVTHQTQELWFKLLLFELTEIRDRLRRADLEYAAHLLRRATVVQRLLADHWSVLDTMLPTDYAAFRKHLKGGSGFESTQYWELEFLLGNKRPDLLNRLRLDTGERDRLQRRLHEDSLREAFLTLVREQGFASVDDVFRQEPDSWPDGRWGVLQLGELLIDFDNAFTQWRSKHVLMVERQIGAKSGTGGTSGASYLRARLHERFFPELWDARSRL